MRRQQFERLVDRAIASIPGQFLERVENLSFQVEAWADPATLDEVGFDDPRDLLGFYRGIPLDERGHEVLPEMPDVIVLYQGAIEDHAHSSGDSLQQVIRETVIHELAHYFGFSEEQMDAIEELWAADHETADRS